MQGINALTKKIFVRTGKSSSGARIKVGSNCRNIRITNSASTENMCGTGFAALGPTLDRSFSTICNWDSGTRIRLPDNLDDVQIDNSANDFNSTLSLKFYNKNLREQEDDNDLPVPKGLELLLFVKQWTTYPLSI